MIQFRNNDRFFDVLNARVKSYMNENHIDTHANLKMKLKLIFLYSGFFLSYILLFSVSGGLPFVLLMGFIYGLFGFLLGFNVVHDAGHNALFKSKKWNSLCTLTLDLFGVSSFIWRSTHNNHHHSPNVVHHDSLVDDFNIGKITPGVKSRPIHKFQVIYIPILSLLYSAALFLMDFTKFKRFAKVSKLSKRQTTIEVLKIILAKVVAIFVTILLPYWFLDLTLFELFLLFAFIHLGPGLMVGFFVAPSHFNSQVSYPEPDANNFIDSSWSEHQLMTIQDFGTQNVLLNFSLGGFNHHVAHHLFPNICHIHYPKLTQIIKATAEEMDLPYYSTSFPKLYISYLKHIYAMGIESQKDIAMANAALK